MQLHITPRHIKLTGAIHAYVAEKLSHLEHEVDHIMGMHVVLWHDETKSPDKAFHVKVHLAVPGPDIFAEGGTGDLYSAIDVVVDKLAAQLRKRKTKTRDKSKAMKFREKQKRLGVR